MGEKKAAKRDVRKIFRNAWLISMPVFVVGVVGFKYLGVEEGMPRNITLALMGFSSVIGGISFLFWISILIFSNTLARIAMILLGIIVSSLYWLTVYSIAYIYAFSRVPQDSIEPLAFLDIALPLVTFGIVLFVWLRTKPMLVKATILIVLAVLYFLGRAYAIDAYKPLKKAMNLTTQANSSAEMAWTNETDVNKYLEGERKWVGLFEEAAGSIKTEVFRAGAKEYFVNLYQVQRAGLEYDEQAFLGKATRTQEEIDKFKTEITEKRYSAWSAPVSIPFWTDFFMVK